MMVSVVMPVYNGAKYLQNSIDSILNQTFWDFEFIIVNDGSTDETTNILNENQARDNRIKVIHLKENAGVANARNVGVWAAQGKWIAIQDSDDISVPHRLETQLNYVEEHKDPVAVGSMIKCIPGRYSVDKDFQAYLKNTEKWSNALLTREQIKGNRFISTPVVNGSVLFLKEIFMKVGGYNKNYRIGEDFDLWIKMLEYGPIDKIPEVLYHYRVDADSLCHENDVVTCSYLMKIACKHINEMFTQQTGKKPKFLVLGTKEGCHYILKTVVPEVGINVLQYFYLNTRKSLDKIVKQFFQKKADGIIILDSAHSGEYLQYFESKGLVMNENLFRLWNVF
ncbi:MAG: glycosyltransferase family A protein [Bacillota bacterium]|nr:glycosyltransferase family A protein [Bacillota bacterium]